MSNIIDFDVGSRSGTYNMIRVLTKYKNGFNVCHINAQSLHNKIDELRLLFENSNMDAICISETWLKKDIGDSLYAINGYMLFRHDRVKHAGGVAIYLKNSIACKVNCISEIEEKVEYIFLEICQGDNKLLLGCVYRKNRSINIMPLITRLENITLMFPNILIAGDFNSNILIDTCLTNAMKSLNLVPVNSSTPTHFSSSTNTLLDLFFVESSSKVLHYNQLSVPSFSKHDLIFVSYDFIPTRKDQTFTYRNFNNIDYTSLGHDVSTILWNTVFFLPTVDEQIKFLNENIIYLYNKHVPIVTKNIKCNDRPWFTGEIKHLMEVRDSAYKLWKRYKTPDLKDILRQAKRNVVAKIKQSKSIFYKNKFKNAIDTKQTWKEIRKIGISKPKNKIIDADVNELNNKFINIPMPDVQANFYNSNVNNDPLRSDFSFVAVSQLDVIEGFLAVKSNAIGYDGIDPKFIKIILPSIVPYITHIFNHIITSSSFPTEWKIAKIVPIPKTDGECRPIALLSFLSKVFEKLIHQQISNFLQQNNLLTDRQSGFRPKRSCLTTLTDVVEDLRSNMDSGYITFLILLDHSKAFDTVHHPTLAFKLRNMFKFSATSVKLICSYLTGRQQAVFSNGRTSSFLPNCRGVPQGSVLGPLLYSIYANDLPQQLKFCKMHMYADDAQLYLSTSIQNIDSCIKKINYDLKQVNTWATANGLCINPKKSKCLIVCTKNTRISTNIDLFIAESKIALVDTAKNLGVTFDKSLSWSNHINASCGKVYSMLRTLWATHYYTPPKIRMLLAKTKLIPTLLYASELFAGCSAQDRRKLNVTFNNITRYVFGIGRFERISEYSHKIFNLNFDNYQKYKSLLLLHKIIYTREPSYLYDRLSFARSSRGKNIIQIRHTRQLSKRQFFIKTISLWNQLPNEIQKIGNARQFKNNLIISLNNNNGI